MDSPSRNQNPQSTEDDTTTGALPIGKSNSPIQRCLETVYSVAADQDKKIDKLSTTVAKMTEQVKSLQYLISQLVDEKDFAVDPRDTKKTTKRKRSVSVPSNSASPVTFHERDYHGEMGKKRQKVHSPLTFVDIKPTGIPSKELAMAAYLNALPKSEANQLLEEAARRYKSHTEDITRKRKIAVAKRKASPVIHAVSPNGELSDFDGESDSTNQDTEEGCSLDQLFYGKS